MTNYRVAMRVLTAITLLGAAASAAPVAHSDPEPCREVTAEVGPTDAIAGTLCATGETTAIQVLIPGWLNNRNYWDLPFGTGEYSYAQYAHTHGYATLAIDRLGTGRSSRPPSDQLTYQEHVAAVRDVVDALAADRFGKFATILLVGHSYGSRVAYGVASQTSSVDAVVVTSLRQNWISYAALTAAPLTVGPATRDPRRGRAELDPGYVTSLPGSDTGYNAANADPDVIATAKATAEDVGSLSETNTARDAMPTQSAGITVPTLIVVGTADVTTCGPASIDCQSPQAVAEQERPRFGPGASVDVVLIPGSGHAINLERTRCQAWRAISEFADGVAGRAALGTQFNRAATDLENGASRHCP